MDFCNNKRRLIYFESMDEDKDPQLLKVFQTEVYWPIVKREKKRNSRSSLQSLTSTGTTHAVGCEY